MNMGLEVRMLAFTYKYDAGDYADVVLNGVVHSKTQELAGLDSRDVTRDFIIVSYTEAVSKVHKLQARQLVTQAQLELVS